MKRFLLQDFDYDLWATRKWIDTLPRWPDFKIPSAILEHMLWAQDVWLRRCTKGVPELTDAASHLPETAQRLNYLWREQIETRDLDEPIAYRNSKGQAFTRRLNEIARHVVNHGTFHRGEIRGKAEIYGVKDWPDTDLVYFLHERGR